MRGTSVEQSLALRDVVDIMEHVAVGQEGELRSGEEEASIEEEAAEEGSGVRLVEDEDVVLDVLPLKEGMHVLDEGGEVLFPGPEGDQDDDPRGGLTVGWSEVAARWQHSCPGLVLLLQVQEVPGGGQGQLLLLPHYGGGTEGKTGGRLSLVLVPCCTSKIWDILGVFPAISQ